MKRTKRAFVRTQDRDGREIILVSLANHHQPAKLFAEDWDRLMAEKVRPQWTLNGHRGVGYVRCSAGGVGGLATVARLIMRAEAGRIIGYRTGDRLNLR